MPKVMVIEKGSGVKLSANFNSNEFDCQCNYPDCTFTLVSIEHLNMLQKMRSEVGFTINISSGFRCQRHNADIGGADRSQHVRGTATDIQVPHVKASAVADVFEDVADGLGRYKTFTHVDSRGYPARWKG